MIQGKFWGNTTTVYSGTNCEVHYLDIKCGGYSSKHAHKQKWNRFYILEGGLTINVFRDIDGEEMVESITLRRGDTTDVAPGVKHQFEAPCDCLCLEIYWTDDLDPNDIERFSVGGRKISKSP